MLKDVPPVAVVIDETLIMVMVMVMVMWMLMLMFPRRRTNGLLCLYLWLTTN